MKTKYFAVLAAICILLMSSLVIAIEPIGTIFGDSTGGRTTINIDDGKTDIMDFTVGGRESQATDPDTGRAASYSRGYKIDGYLCSEYADYEVDYTPSSSSIVRVSYTNGHDFPVVWQVFRIESNGGWSNLCQVDASNQPYCASDAYQINLNPGETKYYYVTYGVNYKGVYYYCEDQTATSCSDSDNGLDYLHYGEVIVNPNNVVWADDCYGDDLQERYCDAYQTAATKSINCVSQYGSSYQCKDGACVYGMSCAVHDYTQCYSGHVYYYDGCDRREERADFCDPVSEVCVDTSSTTAECQAAAPTCTDDCSYSGQRQCNSDGERYRTCGYYDSDTCLDWSSYSSCGTGYDCTGAGQCTAETPTCTNECTTSGAKKCVNGGYQTCGQFDTDTCLEWSSTSTCPTGQTCTGAGVCTNTCTDTCATEGYSCGTQTICGSSVNCGTCGDGFTCSSAGTCTATDTKMCLTCEGDQSVQVPYSSGTPWYTGSYASNANFFDRLFGIGRQATDPGVCEGLLDQYGNTMSTLYSNPVCINDQPIANPQYFKPKIKGFYVEDTDGEWLYVAPGSSVPARITNTWRAGENIPVILHFSNEDADNYDTTQDTAAIKAEKGALAAFANNLWNDVTSFRNVAGVGKVVDFVEWVDSGFDNEEIATENKQVIDSVPWMNIGIAEIAFYGNDASTYAYGDYYSRYGVPTIGEPTVHRVDACQGEEHLEGWIDHFAVLMTPPIDGNCWSYDDPEYERQIYDHSQGGACDVKIYTEIKVPVAGDAIASGISNWDAEGKYRLHGAVFDTCWYDGLDRDLILGIGDAKAQITAVDPGTQVCCEQGSWFFGLFPKFWLTTEAECNNLAQSNSYISIADDPNKCYDNAGEPYTYPTEACYHCDQVTGVVDQVTVWQGDCGDPDILGPDNGWTTDRDAAYNDVACAGIDPEDQITCKSCGGTGEKLIPDNEECPANYYDSTTVVNGRTDYQRICIDTCGGDTCQANEVCYNYECVKTGTDSDCNPACNAAQECVEVSTGSYECRTIPPQTKEINCYECTATDPYYVVKGQYTLKANNDEYTCHQEGLLSAKEAVTDAVCLKPENRVYTAIVNPDNEEEWCLKHQGITEEEACEIFSAPRKDHVPFSELDKLDELGTWTVFSGTAYVDWFIQQDNPLCVNDWGDNQCWDGGECLAAKNSERSLYADNLIIYEAVKDVLEPKGLFSPAGWDWTAGLFGANGDLYENVIESYGVCVPEQRDAFTNLKASIAELFGLDPDDPAVNMIIIGGIIGIFGLLYFATKPPRPRSPARY